ncbi:MAG TPA: serine/threonine-protein kinase, partial [Polyangiaceae bacterium]|nr:serine/threonine-protein kinase [Polyangiaceae bacterium]
MGQEPVERLGEYEVLAPISQGGMGSVSLGRPLSRPGELVALKVIRAEYGRNKDFVAMLLDEAGIASRLSHPNILAIRALGQDGTRHFLVMELLRGHSLLDVSRRAHALGKRLPYEVVAWIGARIADALEYAHDLADDRGAPLHVVHRDVNPANIFLTQEGTPKLIDFGLAKARDRIASTAIGVVKGKLAYLAPEQAHGKPADRRSDVFALGVTLWETALDRRLFHDESDVETVRRVREADVPDPRTLDP